MIEKKARIERKSEDSRDCLQNSLNGPFFASFTGFLFFSQNIASAKYVIFFFMCHDVCNFYGVVLTYFFKKKSYPWYHVLHKTTMTGIPSTTWPNAAAVTVIGVYHIRRWRKHVPTTCALCSSLRCSIAPNTCVDFAFYHNFKQIDTDTHLYLPAWCQSLCSQDFFYSPETNVFLLNWG